jgi:hypothetical protein
VSDLHPHRVKRRRRKRRDSDRELSPETYGSAATPAHWVIWVVIAGGILLLLALLEQAPR